MKTTTRLTGKLLAWLAGAWWCSTSFGQVVSEGPDHATQALHSPWDMREQADVFPLLWTHNLAAAQVSGGVLTATARDTDPHFWLQFPRIPSAFSPVNLLQPAIDAGTYTKLSFLMWLPDTIVAGTKSGRLVWHSGGATVEAFDAAYSEIPPFPVYPGWYVYSFDLANTAPSRGTPWAGQVQGLRIDPCLGCQVDFKLDWARLYNDADATASLTLPVGKTHAVTEVVPTASATALPVAIQGVAGKASFARLPPGEYRVAPISDGDYALSHRAKAWNFNSQADTLWGANAGFSNAATGPRGFTGTTNGPDPVVYLDVPAAAPIDATKYRHIAVDMTLNRVPAQESGLLVWWGSQTASPQFPSAFTPIQAGRATYRIDLGQSAQWRGIIKALRIDPLNGPNAGSGVEVTIHSVRLTRSNGFQEDIVFNSVPVVVNGRPSVSVQSPGFETGEDYALVEQGRAWDMLAGQVRQPQLSNLSGWETVNRIPGVDTTGSFFHGTSAPAPGGQSEGDPHAFLAFQENTNPIDANAYRWLGFDLHVPMDATQQSELTRGAVARLAWKTDDGDPGVTSDDIVLLPGLQRYWFDMGQIVYEPTTARTWGGLVRYLRIDPFEFPESRHFYLGPTQLRSTPSARWVVPVTVTLFDPEGDPLSVTVKAGNAIVGQASGLGNGTHQILAGVSALPVGEHVLRVEVSDGKNTTTRNASVPFVKLPVLAALPVSQIKAADRIFDWAEGLLGETLGPGTPSGSAHTCFSGIPGSYGRHYAASDFCLFTVDGLLVFSAPGTPLSLIGSLAQFLPQATPRAR